MDDRGNNEPSLVFSEAVLAVKLGQNDLARTLFKKVLQSNPQHEQALLWSAALSKQPLEAVRLLERVLKINPSNPQALTTLSMLRLSRASSTQESTESEGQGSGSTSVVLSGRTWICPLCGLHGSGSPEQCDRCGAIYQIHDLRAISANKRADEQLLLGALQRWEQAERYAKTYEGQLNLARIYLNLRRSHEAIPHIRKAMDLRGEDRDLVLAIDQLLARPLVLAVDDSLTIRRIVPIIVETAGYRAMVACDGEEALTKVGEAGSAPDLVLLDVDMPGLNGYQVCRAMRQMASLKQIPIVILSGSLLDRIKGRLSGVTDYVAKPFEPESLRSVMRKYLPSASLPL
jgi:CheY-like chemotaxis protein